MKRGWRVLLMAKGIQQVVKVPELAGYLITTHQTKAGGRVIRNRFRYIKVNEATKYAEAVFERSW